MAAPPGQRHRLGLLDRAAERHRRPPPRLAARPRHRRLELPQRHGPCARPPQRLRRLGGGGLPGLELRRPPALLHPLRALGARTVVLSRRPRADPTGHADGAASDHALLHGRRRGDRPRADRRAQRRAHDRPDPQYADAGRRPPPERRRCLPDAGRRAAQPHGHRRQPAPRTGVRRRRRRAAA